MQTSIANKFMSRFEHAVNDQACWYSKTFKISYFNGIFEGKDKSYKKVWANHFASMSSRGIIFQTVLLGHHNKQLNSHLNDSCPSNSCNLMAIKSWVLHCWVLF